MFSKRPTATGRLRRRRSENAGARQAAWRFARAAGKPWAPCPGATPKSIEPTSGRAAARRESRRRIRGALRWQRRDRLRAGSNSDHQPLSAPAVPNTPRFRAADDQCRNFDVGQKLAQRRRFKKRKARRHRIRRLLERLADRHPGHCAIRRRSRRHQRAKARRPPSRAGAGAVKWRRCRRRTQKVHEWTSPRRTADTQYKRGRRGYGGGVPTPLHRPEMGGARSLRWGTEPRPLGRQVRAGYRGIGLAQPTNLGSTDRERTACEQRQTSSLIRNQDTLRLLFADIRGRHSRDGPIDQVMSRRPYAFQACDVRRAIKAAASAGMEIAAVEIGATGEIRIVVGKPGSQSSGMDELDRQTNGIRGTPWPNVT